MAESGPHLKPVVYVAPIWQRKKRIKSFKQAAAIILELIRLGAYSKQARLTLEAMTEQLKQLANEDQTKRERLRKVQCLARIKKTENMELSEWKQQHVKVYRERMHQFAMLEKMKQYDGNRWMDKPTNNAAFLGSLRHFGIENRKLGSPTRLGTNQRVANECKATTPAGHRLAANCLMKQSNKNHGAFGADEESRRLRECHQMSTASSKDAESKFQLSSPDGTRDPRFQNLLRSLTPTEF